MSELKAFPRRGGVEFSMLTPKDLTNLKAYLAETRSKGACSELTTDSNYVCWNGMSYWFPQTTSITLYLPNEVIPFIHTTTSKAFPKRGCINIDLISNSHLNKIIHYLDKHNHNQLLVNSDMGVLETYLCWNGKERWYADKAIDKCTLKDIDIYQAEKILEIINTSTSTEEESTIEFKPDTVYIADTEEEADMLLREAHKQGYEWMTEGPYVKDGEVYNNWNRYNSVYYNIVAGTYGNQSILSEYYEPHQQVTVKELFKLNKQTNENSNSVIKENRKRERSGAVELPLRGYRRFHKGFFESKQEKAKATQTESRRSSIRMSYPRRARELS